MGTMVELWNKNPREQKNPTNVPGKEIPDSKKKILRLGTILLISYQSNATKIDESNRN